MSAFTYSNCTVAPVIFSVPCSHIRDRFYKDQVLILKERNLLYERVKCTVSWNRTVLIIGYARIAVIAANVGKSRIRKRQSENEF